MNASIATTSEAITTADSPFTAELNAIDVLLTEMETDRHENRIDSPIDRLVDIEMKMNAIQDEMVKSKNFDRTILDALLKYRSRKIEIGIQMKVHWAQAAVGRLMQYIEDEPSSRDWLTVTKEPSAHWWFTNMPKSDSFHQVGQSRIGTAERAFEQAAITVQGLSEQDQKTYGPIIEELRQKLKTVSITPIS